jgi:hypothetical protein
MLQMLSSMAKVPNTAGASGASGAPGITAGGATAAGASPGTASTLQQEIEQALPPRGNFKERHGAAGTMTAAGGCEAAQPFLSGLLLRLSMVLQLMKPGSASLPEGAS